MRVCYLVFCLLLIFDDSANAQQARFDGQTYTRIPAGASLDFVGTGDVNGDGLTDIVAAQGFYEDTTFLWLQAGNGQMHAALTFHTGSIRCMTVADLYGDGTAEVLLGTGNFIKVYEWVNNTLVLTDTIHTISNSDLMGITTGDLDSNGLTDIAVCYNTGKQLTVIYQELGTAKKWDVRHYNTVATGDGHVFTGRFGPLQQTSLVYISTGTAQEPIQVMLFDMLRNLQQKYIMQLPVINNINLFPNSATIIRKGTTNTNELWVITDGNVPRSMVAIWRGLQTLPDSTFDIKDIPETIQAANLDCDEDDEAVILHGGWHSLTVVTDTPNEYFIKTPTHYKQESLALADVNNDGRIDICIANDVDTSALWIIYNTTPPCWPATVTPPLDNTKQLLLYPNPATERIRIQHTTTGILQIMDAQGRQMHRSEFRMDADIDTRSWPAGIYFVILHNNEGNRWTAKMLKY